MNHSRSTKSRFCFPRNHQTPGESALHNYMAGASRKSGVFYSDDRRDAGQFESPKDAAKRISKNTITKWRHGLENKGWIERLDKGPRQRNPVTGLYASIRYRVLTHNEWVAKYPDRCEAHASQTQPQEPTPCLGDSSDVQSQSLGQAPVPIQSQLTDTTCPKQRIPPVPAIGTKREEKERKERENGENKNHSLSSDKQAGKTKTRELADVVVATALGINTGASFSAKSKAEIERVIAESGATEDELQSITRTIVQPLDNFALKNAGSAIAAALAAHVTNYRKREQSRRDEQDRLAEMERFVDEQQERDRREIDKRCAEIEAQRKRDAEQQDIGI